MEWTKENILEFIDLYKETTVLWDPKDPFHYNKVKKNEAWEDIAREIGRNAEECRRKMEYLLAALRREKMKIKSSLLKGKDHKITWFAFDSLKFLLEERRPRKGTEVVPINDTMFPPVDDSDFNDDTSMIVVKHGHDYADKTATPPPSKRARTDGETPAASSGNTDAAPKSVGHFANYITTKLESYSARTRAAVEHAISNLLFVADLGQFDYLSETSEKRPLPREKGNGGQGTSGGGSVPQRSAGAPQTRSQTSTPTPAGPRSAKARAAAAAAASSSKAAEQEVSQNVASVSQTQSYQELFDSNNFEDDDAMEKREMDDGGSTGVEIIVA